MLFFPFLSETKTQPNEVKLTLVCINIYLKKNLYASQVLL